MMACTPGIKVGVYRVTMKKPLPGVPAGPGHEFTLESLEGGVGVQPEIRFRAYEHEYYTGQIVVLRAEIL